MTVALFVSAVSVGCPDDSATGPSALEGSRPGFVRYVVYFADAPLDLSAYKAALAAGEDTGPIVEGLRNEAKMRRLDFAKRIAELGGVVVDYWYMTNAVTVEIPDGSAATLTAMEGVAKAEPDRVFPAPATP